VNAMARRLTRKLIALVTALTLLLAFLVPPMSTQAYATTSQRTVKVGLFDTDTTSEAGNESGSVLFQKAYMQAIAEYANWKIEYVEAPWNKLIEMEKNGDIDVLMDVSMTEERTNYFNYSKEAMGTEMCYIFGNKDTKLGYDDFKDFDGLTLGYEKGSTIYTSVERYAEDNGFKLKGKPYKSGAAMFAALDAGKVDMVAQTNYYETPAGHVILARCYPEPVYVVTSKKHPSLQKELDSAMSQLLSYNAGFNVDMFELYFGSNSSKNVGFTKKERAYLEKKPTVYVYYETDWAPFEYDNNGEAGGITPDIIRAIGKETGIKFKFVLSASTQMVYKGVKENSKDTIMAVSYDYSWAAAHDLLVTEPYVTGSVMRVTKNENAEPKTVAVMKSGYLAHQVKKMYPKLKQVNYSNTEECMNAVRDGKADCTFINYYQTTYYRTSTKYQSFDYQPVSNITQNISLGVTKESNPLLLSILSKSLQRISSDEVQSILSENSAKNQGLSFGLLMRKYPMQMALGLGSLGILIGIIIFLIVSLGNRKRQNAEMEKAKLAAESANRAKSDFLSRMSHDIRTPLNGIIGMTYLANSQEHSTEVGEYLDKIDTSSKYLLSLINDILDMSKAEKADVELYPEPYSPEDFAAYMDAVIKPLMDEKKQILSTDVQIPEGYIPEFDKLRINQVVFNLLSNAMKYTPEGGSILYYVKGKMLGDDKMQMHIEVSDNGIGISSAFQEHIFEPFTQEHEADFGTGSGTGLGMAITKNIIDLMGGTIAIESEEGRGSKFLIDLTVAAITREASNAEHFEAKEKQDNDSGKLAGKKILLCEDHPINQEIAIELLKNENMTVDLAENGQEGVDIFKNSDIGYYDAVLMDIRMPIMNGYEAAKAIRGIDRSDAQTVPIIAMTADAFEDDV